MILKKLPVGYHVFDEEHGVTIIAKRLTEQKDNLYAFVIVHANILGEEKKLYMGKLNLTSTRSKKELANYLDSIWNEVPWKGILEKISQLIIENYYSPEPAEKLTIRETTDISFLLYPLLPKGYPTLWYAPGGSGKSLLALYIALLVQNGITLYHEYPETQQTNVLYLDWEVDRAEMERRVSMFCDNFEENVETPFYKKCLFSLVDELEDILTIIAENDIGFVIIDSAAPAIGGDINDAQKVITFFQAIRQIIGLGATVLIITHVSKAHKEKEEERSPIGSVFFENFPRLTWELRFITEDNTIHFGLFPRKTNFGKLPAIGFRVIFDFGKIFVTFSEPERISTTTEITKKDSIIEFLMAKGQATVREIAQRLGLRKEYVWRILSDLKRKGVVRNTPDGLWIFESERSDY